VGEAVSEGCTVPWYAVVAGCGRGAGLSDDGIDRWESRAAYEEFRAQFASEYEELESARDWRRLRNGLANTNPK
jgi:hypothetical protein